MLCSAETRSGSGFAGFFGRQFSPSVFAQAIVHDGSPMYRLPPFWALFVKVVCSICSPCDEPFESPFDSLIL